MSGDALVLSVPLHISTAAQAWAALNKIPDLSPKSKSDLIMFIVGQDDADLARKIFEKESYKDLPDEKALRQALSKVLYESWTTKNLFYAMALNPQDDLRADIFSVVIRKPGVSASLLTAVFLAQNELFIPQEIEQMIQCVLRERNKYNRQSAARGVLESIKPHAGELRTRLLEAMNWQARYVFEQPEHYFPPSSPVTPEERKVIIEHLKADEDQAVKALSIYGTEHDALKFLPEELQDLIPIVLAHADQHDADRILANSAAVTLFSEDQRKQLEAIAGRSAA